MKTHPPLPPLGLNDSAIQSRRRFLKAAFAATAVSSIPYWLRGGPNRYDKRAETLARMESNVLSLHASGNTQYPVGHSVFTNNVQDELSYSSHAPNHLVSTKDNAYRYLDTLDGDYEDSNHGSSHIQKLTKTMTLGGNGESIERYLVKVVENGVDSDHDPLYRLSDTSTIDNPNIDFEVLAFTGGTGYDGNRFKFDAYMLNHAVENTYGDRLKHFQLLDNPTKQQIDDAISDRSISARDNGRKLYVFYRGHGDFRKTISFPEGKVMPDHQDGVPVAHREKQGSRILEFNIKEHFDENDYKSLFTKHSSDIEVVSSIGCCYSGAAISATSRPFFNFVYS